MQIFLITIFTFLYLLNEDIYSKVERNRCSLLYGDTILRQDNGYTVKHVDGRALFTRRINETILFPEPCTSNASVQDGRGNIYTFECLSQTFLFTDNRPYYAFRLFRRSSGAAAHADDGDVLVQGAFSEGCGDWMNATGCSDIQLVIRTDLNSGQITLGYPPVPLRREPGSEDVSFYVDGSALVMTSLNRGRS